VVDDNILFDLFANPFQPLTLSPFSVRQSTLDGPSDFLFILAPPGTMFSTQAMLHGQWE